MKSFIYGFACLLLCGCSTFNRDWRKLADSNHSTSTLEGRWDGRWISNENGHNGRLRAIVSEQDDGGYEARYRATYAKIFRFEYTADLVATESDGRFEFNGSADLGKMAGGLYEYEGHAVSNQFFSTYDSKYDHGTFEMTRPLED